MVRMRDYLDVLKIIFYFISLMRIVEVTLVLEVNAQYVNIKFVFFCSYNLNDQKYDRENCCLRRSINKSIFYNGLRYILEIDKNSNSYEENIKAYQFIPGLSLFAIIAKIYCILYLDVATKKSLRNNRLYDTYRNELEKGNYHKIMMIILIAIDINLCIPFLIYNIFSLILMVIISIPFKFYPLKFFHYFIN